MLDFLKQVLQCFLLLLGQRGIKNETCNWSVVSPMLWRQVGRNVIWLLINSCLKAAVTFQLFLKLLIMIVSGFCDCPG